ncbi:MAG: S8 family serine peptidase, partial [Rhodothermales bacterium]|nr:S8 family serine peptidase [Rhodothermales bacterium]
SQVFIVSGIKKDLLLKLIDMLKKRLEDVDHVEINEPIELDDPISTDSDEFDAGVRFLTNDPLANQQWAMQGARIDAAHKILEDLKPVRKAVVAILDTGVDARHEDIVGSFLSESPATTDSHGHGTHCAGIAGAATNNSTGMASLNWDGRFVEISSYAALGSTGMGTVETMAQAIIDATTDGADVISMSLGEFSLFPIKVVTDAVKFAQKRGVIVVAAAGNSNQDAKMHLPSNIDGVIAVAAVDENNRKASFSNTNASLSRPIAAPGVNIMSLEPNGKYGKKSGTSMATPLVAGLIGVMRAINPELTAEQVYTILEGTGKAGADAKRVGNTIQSDAAIRVAAGNIVVRS